MTSRDFCYWLQGYFEIEHPKPHPPEWMPSLNSDQIEIIRNHLNMVFKHEIDPSHGDKEHQNELTKLHSPKTKLEKFAEIEKCDIDDSPIYRC